jgi:drug/metabolite transporter (DMT)-like permease
MALPPENPPPPRDLRVWGALLIVYVVWGSTYLAIRITVETLPPMLSAGLRFLAAGVILGTILAVRGGLGRLRVTARQFAAAAVIGVLLLAGGNGGVVYAEAGPPGQAVPSGVAALLIALVPLLVVLMRSITRDRPPAATFVGVVVGFAGLVTLVAAGTGVEGVVPLRGALIVVAAATSWAVGSFASRKVPLPADPFVATVYESLAGGVVLTVLGLLRGESLQVDQVSTRSWLGLAYLVVAGSLVAFTAYVWLLQSAPISLTATYAYVNPAVAVALGALIVHEPVTPAILIGGVIIIVGVALVVSTERPRAPVRSRE